MRCYSCEWPGLSVEFGSIYSGFVQRRPSPLTSCLLTSVLWPCVIFSDLCYLSNSVTLKRIPLITALNLFICSSLLTYSSFFLMTALLLNPPSLQTLQDAQASEGQVVVLECRVRGSPPLQVRWYRQGEEILDSPDFRILQKSKALLVVKPFVCGWLLVYANV